MQGAVMNRDTFNKVYRKAEAVHNREVSDLDVQRAWDRYERIVLKGK